MKQIVFGCLAALLGVLSIVGGIGIVIGMVAYSIYLLVLMITGTIAVSFIGVFKIVLCWIGAVFCGWIWAIVVGFLSALCATIAAE